jgi:hypothetical protein
MDWCELRNGCTFAERHRSVRKSAMRGIVVLAVTLLAVGCATTTQEVAETLGSRFVGKSVDALVSEFGPPASTFRMHSGEAAYAWQLTAATNINTNQGVGYAKTYYCKVNVIASPAGIVTKLTTQDMSGTGGVLGLVGVDIYGSMCARHLRIMPIPVVPAQS